MWPLLAMIADAVTFILCPVSVLFLAYWAFLQDRGKPDIGYDCDPPTLPFDSASRLYVLRRRELRRMFRESQTDEDVLNAMDWGTVLSIPKHEIEAILDEVSPLGSDDQRVALAVRRMYAEGFSA